MLLESALCAEESDDALLEAALRTVTSEAYLRHRLMINNNNTDDDNALMSLRRQVPTARAKCRSAVRSALTTVALAGKSFAYARAEALRALDAIEAESSREEPSSSSSSSSSSSPNDARPILLLHDDPTCKLMFRGLYVVEKAAASSEAGPKLRKRFGPGPDSFKLSQATDFFMYDATYKVGRHAKVNI